MTANPARFDRLAAWMAKASGAADLQIIGMHKLAGGAIQENWHLEILANGGVFASTGSVVLRTDAPSSVGESHSRAQEFALLRTAHAAGVKVATPHFLCSDDTIIGTPFFIMDYCSGQGQARRITRDPALADFGDRLAGELGREMARIHAVTTSAAELSFLPLDGDNAAVAQLADSRAAPDVLAEGQPVIEYALNWLEDRLDGWQRTAPRRLCHRDFRSGNFLVEAGRLTAVLDWEFAGWSDPAEDIGWLCARCWRFGNDDLVVGGIAGFAPFKQAYEAESGTTIDIAAVVYWQLVAEIRWAIIALQQQERALFGGETSLELALSGYLAAEMESNMLALISAMESGAKEGPI